MSRLSLFNSPLLLGFDHFERALDRVSKISSDGYPPYNIEQLGENALRITLAVAGFAMGDLGITIEDNQLVVRGKQADDPQRVYLHRGIAARQFQRSFVLAEGIEVRGARLDNGLLHIDLVRPEVESRVRTIEIASGEIASGEIAGGEIAGGEIAGGEIAGGEIAGGEIAGGEIAGGEIAGDSQRPPSGARAETQERASSAVERIR